MANSSFETFNPATGEKLAAYRHFDAAEIERTLAAASLAYAKRRSVAERSADLVALAKSLRESATELARSISLEMGKPLKDALNEIEKCAVGCEYFAKNLEAFLAIETVSTGYARSLVVKDPIGPMLAIMPWNFPVWQVIRFAAPAVGIGNPILLKHSDLTAGTAELIARAFDRVRPGLLFNLRIDHEQAAAVIGDRRVAAVTLTGSARAGAEVAQVAGRHLKKSVLELGGSDAYVVLDDADVERAAAICAQSRMLNNGQSCICAKRFLVHRPLMPRFLEAFTAALKAHRRGDPFAETTQTGPLAAKKFQKQLIEQCTRLEKAGATSAFDIAREEKFDFAAPGAYFPARVYRLSAEPPAIAFDEEFFGPVALVFEFDTEDQALALANRSRYGLGGGVFSRDLDRAQTFARRMEAGFVAINDFVRSDPALPFGGVKDSGYGRELSLHGFNEFCNVKTLGFGK